ncbi:MAG: FkbM family methyltransferase [Candidatus Bathyarchaeota archaeon]|nr:FkbM family methyltransferase [Candidatus Bathyarchaeota archaeon]
MVTLTGLIKTLTVTSKPLDCLPYPDRKKIQFRRGPTLELTFPQFRNARDNISLLKRYGIRQVTYDLFEADFGDFKMTANLKIVCRMCQLADFFEKNNYQITKVDEDIFRIKKGKLELEGTFRMLEIFKELNSGAYEADFNDRVVLDIGGFQGESAVYFGMVGAKKVIVYEPVHEYCRLIEKNASSNHVNAEIHCSGIGNENTITALSIFDPVYEGSDQPRKEIVKITNITDIINQSKADIAKIDCEGAEICLTTVPSEVLRKIPQYIIELHGLQVRKAVTSKFLEAGFKITKSKGGSISTVHFQQGIDKENKL